MDHTSVSFIYICYVYLILRPVKKNASTEPVVKKKKKVLQSYGDFSSFTF
jgi:hypothetical protein